MPRGGQRKYPEEFYTRVLTMYASGIGQREIARRLDVNANVVLGIVFREKHKAGKPKFVKGTNRPEPWRPPLDASKEDSE